MPQIPIDETETKTLVVYLLKELSNYLDEGLISRENGLQVVEFAFPEKAGRIAFIGTYAILPRYGPMVPDFVFNGIQRITVNQTPVLGTIRPQKVGSGRFTLAEAVQTGILSPSGLDPRDWGCIWSTLKHLQYSCISAEPAEQAVPW